MNTPDVVLIALSPVLAWRMYSRTRRLVTRQQSSKRRHWFPIGIYAVLLSLLTWYVLPAWRGLAWMLLGLAAGAALAALGLRLTKYERTPQGLFYTPNIHIGIALSVVFIGRILYRFVEIFFQDHSATGGPPDFVSHPSTLIIFSVMAGYFVGYAVGMLRWRHSLGR